MERNSVFRISNIAQQPSNGFVGQVWQYIQATYVLDDIEHILISGDGASWMKSGVES